MLSLKKSVDSSIKTENWRFRWNLKRLLRSAKAFQGRKKTGNGACLKKTAVLILFDLLNIQSVNVTILLGEDYAGY